MKNIICISLLLLPALAQAQIRTVKMKQDEILTVHCALGVATMVEVPTALQPNIIGDQSAFRVENYQDHAVSIKPLRFRAHTNLYLMTLKRRFNLRLVTVAPEKADYYVYIKDDDNRELSWSALPSKRFADFTIKNILYTYRPEGLVVRALISATKTVTLRPDAIWVYQKSEPLAIDSLYLSDTKGQAVTVALFIARAEFKDAGAIKVSLVNSARDAFVIPAERRLP